MSNAINSLAHEGDAISHRVGRVLIVLTCVRPGASYRVAVQYSSTGAEIPELTANYSGEATARVVARNACHAFAGNRTVATVLEQIGEARRTAAAPTSAPVVLIHRTELARETGPAGLSRITAPQYRLLAACLAGGTDELTRGDGEASITTLRTLAQFGAADLITDPYGEVVGARVTGFGWRVLAGETARRAGKPSPQFVPVPVGALASAHVSPRLRLVAAA